MRYCMPRYMPAVAANDAGSAVIGGRGAGECSGNSGRCVDGARYALLLLARVAFFFRYASFTLISRAITTLVAECHSELLRYTLSPLPLLPPDYAAMPYAMLRLCYRFKIIIYALPPLRHR